MDPASDGRQTLMPAHDAVRLLQALERHGVGATLGGGWCVDALVGEQTREHSDLDLWVSAPGFERFVVAASELGVDRVTPWPGDRPWNFVVTDGTALRLDLHLYEVRDDGDIHYGSALGGHRFPADALAGTGHIAGQAFRCESAAWALRFHEGYPPRVVDEHDVALLRRMLGGVSHGTHPG